MNENTIDEIRFKIINEMIDEVSDDLEDIKMSKEKRIKIENVLNLFRDLLSRVHSKNLTPKNDILKNKLGQQVERIVMDQLVLWFEQNPDRRIVSLSIDTLVNPPNYLIVSELCKDTYIMEEPQKDKGKEQHG